MPIIYVNLLHNFPSMAMASSSSNNKKKMRGNCIHQIIMLEKYFAIISIRLSELYISSMLFFSFSCCISIKNISG